MKTWLLIFPLLFTTSVTANTVVYGTVDKLHINQQGLILLKLDANPASDTFPNSDCGIVASDTWHFKIEPSNAFHKEFYSTLLTALASKRVIYVGHSSNCGTGFAAVNISHLYFQ